MQSVSVFHFINELLVGRYEGMPGHGEPRDVHRFQFLARFLAVGFPPDSAGEFPDDEDKGGTKEPKSI